MLQPFLAITAAVIARTIGNARRSTRERIPSPRQREPEVAPARERTLRLIWSRSEERFMHDAND